MQQPHRIDVHRHVIPPTYRSAMRDAGVDTPIAGVAYPTWDVETDLEEMDRFGIQSAVVSITAPGVGFVTGRAAATVARAVNEYLAQLRTDYPARYGAFAVLPLPDVEAALAEIDYATGVLGLEGVGLFSNHGGTYLGDPAFDRIFARLAEGDVLTFVHPAIPPVTDQPQFGLPPSLYEFPFDTTRMVANLLYSGTLDRHPGLRLIVAHAGGTVPFLAKRLTYADTINPELAPRRPADLFGSLRRLYYDTAMSANPHTLAALTSLIGTDHILFGSDYPFMPASTTAETVDGVNAFFGPGDRQLVERDNAMRLLPQLGRAPGPARANA